MLDTTVSYPIYDRDLFAEDALKNPFGHYRAMRNLGPVVRLIDPDALALPRFADVQAALRAPDILTNGAGVGFNDAFNSLMGKVPNLISTDGATHRRIRAEVARPMMPGALKQYREMLKSMITQRVREMADGQEFDAVERVAMHLPIQAISYLVGLPEDGRQHMLRWATAVFNLVGPASKHNDTDLATIRELRDYLLSVDEKRLSEDSWAKRLLNAGADGKLSPEEARSALSAYAAPSLDTTINAKSNLLLNLARNPDQWNLLKENPSLVPSAVVEGVRHSAVVRWFARFAVADYRHADVFIPAGTRVMIMYGSANRDERHYPDPDSFQVARNPQDQLGWGTGPHMCGGMHLAKLEMEVLLEALIENVDSLEAGEPVVGANRGLYGLASLPMRMTPLS